MLRISIQKDDNMIVRNRTSLPLPDQPMIELPLIRIRDLRFPVVMTISGISLSSGSDRFIVMRPMPDFEFCLYGSMSDLHSFRPGLLTFLEPTASGNSCSQRDIMIDPKSFRCSTIERPSQLLGKICSEFVIVMSRSESPDLFQQLRIHSLR